MPILSKPEVFIIESLRFSDERNNRFEGQIVKQVLALSGKTCEYYYIRTMRELEKVLRLFTKSGYRNPHLSCHGSESDMATTLDSLTLSRLGELLVPHPESRRLFVSACGMTNHRLARALWPASNCFSMLGPAENIAFADAAILWASLYHVLFAEDSRKVVRSVLQAKAQEVADLYSVHLRCFLRSTSERLGYRHVRIRPRPVAAA